MEAVTPGQSAGLCVGEPEPSTAYWSCWAFTMLEDGTYPKQPASYLIDPLTWTETSSLAEQTDITEGIFPAMYGGWMCQQPKEWEGTMYSDCMRFLPSDEYSNSTDVRFETGPMQIATYLTSRVAAADIDAETAATDGWTAEEPCLSSTPSTWTVTTLSLEPGPAFLPLGSLLLPSHLWPSEANKIFLI